MPVVRRPAEQAATFYTSIFGDSGILHVARYGKAEDWLVAVTVATPRGMMTTESFPA